MRLSPATKERLNEVFRPEDRASAERLIEERCGTNLPFCEELNEYELERIRFAALKLSRGNPARLRDAVELAGIDWRDLLMAVGFGHDVDAHRLWQPGAGTGVPPDGEPPCRDRTV